MSTLPPESEKLLAVSPADFVAERQRLAQELRAAGRTEDASAVTALRKPSAVVFAVNRAARDRPKAAQAAIEAADRLVQAQGGSDLEAFRSASRALDEALDLLSEVAVAHVSPGGKTPTDAMRRRVHDLLRRAVASDETREALARGALLEEPEVVGFSAFTGMSATTSKRKRAPKSAPERAPRKKDEREKRREAERRSRTKALLEDLARAEERLKEASRTVDAAERERARAEREIASIQAKLDRL